ncbi:hypothetical protein K503DRAFT_443150 [Rhizopogon vinicolor AM-OR11-026]|uniref:Uncharacterized protein n=1 Tax=Rhizopogon vinicolor AM-OR11-026 TaxID=1314800 RepID=A0A1B7MPB7_9AGAM|nr:hypothetical protein K503DRAFT_443150 [Rhizopogon vinicolor AM-OR11-026]
MMTRMGLEHQQRLEPVPRQDILVDTTMRILSAIMSAGILRGFSLHFFFSVIGLLAINQASTVVPHSFSLSRLCSFA